MNRFTHKSVVVTGAGHGIGRASAVRFADEGAKLSIVDINGQAAEETAKSIRSAGGSAISLTADVSNPDEVSAAIDRVIQEYERIDVLHSNAGILRTGTALTQTLEDWDATFAVNVRGMFLLAKAVLPSMKENGGGAIVNTASTSGIVGEPNLVAYNSSKAAVVNFTRQLACDFSAEGIRVNCVCPGWIIETGFDDPALAGMSKAEVDQLVKQWVPMATEGKVSDIAAGVTFLASNDAAYVTGHALVIDGGLTVQ